MFSSTHCLIILGVDGLVQDYSNSSALYMELLQFQLLMDNFFSNSYYSVMWWTEKKYKSVYSNHVLVLQDALITRKVAW